jgi:hypothetical protein
MSDRVVEITEEMLCQAIQLVRPMAEQLLGQSWAIWGPPYVCGVIYADDPNPVFFAYTRNGDDIDVDGKDWDPAWGECLDFFSVAEMKVEIARSEHRSSREVAQNAPHLLLEDQKPWGGALYWEHISVGVSGAKEQVDEMIAGCVLECLKGLIFLAKREYDESHKD